MAHRVATFYNVDQPVGLGCPNVPEDVALVRFFLRRIGDAPDNQVPSLAKLEIGSMPGTDLVDAIRDFQKEVGRRGGSCAVDGKVNTAKGIGHGVTSAITGTRYTIAHLNATYRRRYPQFHDHLPLDAKCPVLLSAKLAQSTGAGY